MKKVYILNDGGHNYDDAARFGEITFCLEHNVSKWDISQMYRELNDALADANCDDYIVISSLATLCSVATAILADRFGEVHFLIFKDGKYVERTLILDNGVTTGE